MTFWAELMHHPALIPVSNLPILLLLITTSNFDSFRWLAVLGFSLALFTIFQQKWLINLQERNISLLKEQADLLEQENKWLKHLK